jgi:hypothetical protein
MLASQGQLEGFMCIINGFEKAALLASITHTMLALGLASHNAGIIMACVTHVTHFKGMPQIALSHDLLFHRSHLLLVTCVVASVVTVILQTIVWRTACTTVIKRICQ